MAGRRHAVRVLGPVEIVVDNVVHPLRPMARRLLAILAASPGRVVRAESILDSMWPEHPPPTAGKTLQSHVVHLRRALGSSSITYRATGYLLDLDTVDLDAGEIDRRVVKAETAMLAKRWREAAIDLAAARALVRGVPFDEFAVDEFAAPEVARLSELVFRATELSAACAVRIGNASAMVGPLEGLVMEQPLRESAWANLVHVLVASGRPADAQRAGERAAAVLQRELRAAPGPDLATALATIPRTSTRDAREPTGPVNPRHGRVALLGREEQERSIASFLAATDRRVAGLIVVSGEPGIGKTTLLHAISDRFMETGGLALLGRCDPDLRTAYRPLFDILRAKSDLHLDQAGLHPLGRSALRRHLEPQRTRRGDLALSDAGIERTHLHGAIEDAVRWLAAGRHLLLVIDDLQWADDATLDVLTHLLQRRSGQRVIDDVDIDIAVGVRTDAGPWQRFVAEAIEHNRALVVPLLGLRHETVAAMVGARLAGSAPADLSNDIHASTGGNPLLVNAVLDDLADRGVESHSNVPYKVSLLMAGRLHRLDPETVDILNVAAAAGASFSAPLIARVLSRSVADVERALAAATASHLIVRDEHRPLDARFAHDLLRQAVYESIATERRVELHVRFAEHLDGQAGQVEATADHWRRAGRPIEAARCLLDSAQRERTMHLRGPALRSATLAAELILGHSEAAVLLADLQMFRVELLLELGDRPLARELLRDSRHLAVRGTLAYIRLERLSAKLDVSDARWEDAVRRLQHCLNELAYLGGPGASVDIDAEWCEVQIQLAWVRYWGRPSLDRRSDDEVDAALDEVGARAVASQRVELAHVAGAIQNRQSRFTSPDRALQLAHRSLLAARELDDPVLVADKTFSVGFHLLWRRRLDESEARLGAAAGLFADIAAESRTIPALVYLTVVSRFRGDVATTRRRAHIALEVCEHEQSAIYVAACRANLAWCALRDGDVDAARSESFEATSIWSDPRRLPYPFQGLALWPALALTRQGDSDLVGRLVEQLLAPTQQVLPVDIEQSLTAGDLDSALAWAMSAGFA